jgi:hypothetical protein
MEINSVTPLPSTWKLNSPKAISKPPAIAEAASVEPEVGPTIVTAGTSSVAFDGVASMLMSAPVSV